MKKSTIVSAIMLVVSAFMLSGCIFPYWDDGGYYHHGGGYRDDYRRDYYRDRYRY